MFLARIAWSGGVSAALWEGADSGASGSVDREYGGRFHLVDDLFAGRRLRTTGATVDARDARVLASTSPRTVVGMAHNTGEADRLLPPQAFLKPAGSVIGPGETIPLPAGIGRVDAEAELAVVIGRPARHLTVRDALHHVLGVTCANDVTARDLQRSDPLWMTAKGYDGFTPLGPVIATDVDLDDVEIQLAIDGVALRSATTRDLARSVVECLVYVTSFMTLAPGDVLLTGAPGEFAPISDGSRVAVRVGGVGTLTNLVADEQAHLPDHQSCLTSSKGRVS